MSQLIVVSTESPRIRQGSLFRNTAWMMGGQGTGVLLQAAYFVILARLLGAVNYRVFAGAFAFASLVAQYSPLGTGTVLLRKVSGDQDRFSLVLGQCPGGYLRRRWGPYPWTSSLGPSFPGFAECHDNRVRRCRKLHFAQLTIESGRVFQAFEKMHITAALNLLTNLMRTLAAGGMLLAFHRATAWNWAVASTIVSAASAVVAVVAATACFGWPQLRPRLLLEHGAEGFGYSFAASTSSAYNDLDKTMLSHYGMNLANGIYTMAYRIVDIATIPVIALRDAALPKFFQRGAANVGAVAELSGRLLKRTLPVTVVLAISMFVMAPLLPKVVGSGFVGSILALRWLCLIPVFRSVHQMAAGAALTGAGFQRYRTGSQVVAASLNLGLNVLLIPRYGWLGAAWSSLATDGLLGIIHWSVLRMVVLKNSISVRTDSMVRQARAIWRIGKKARKGVYAVLSCAWLTLLNLDVSRLRPNGAVVSLTTFGKRLASVHLAIESVGRGGGCGRPG